MLCVLCAAVSAGVAEGEVGEQAPLPPVAHGGIYPIKLPRDHMAAVGFVYGSGLPVRPDTPPVTNLRIELSRNLQIDPEAVPSCGVRQLSETTEAEARRACGKSIVGRGFEGTFRIESSGELVRTWAHLTFFNGRYQGGPAILAHGVLESGPRDFVEPITITKGTGLYSTVLDFELPLRGFPGASALRSIDLTLGRPHLRYLLGDCPLPPEIHIAEFKMAHITTEFANGTTISSTVERPCKARG